MRLLMFCGSQRRESWNQRLLEHLARQVGARARLDVLTAREVTLPLFNQDEEGDVVLGAAVDALHSRFARADGLIIASPEYNGQPTPYLKNTLDWVSRWPHVHAGKSNAFFGTPVLMCSATSGQSGGALGLGVLRGLLGYLGATVLGPQICVAFAEQHWTGAGYDFAPFFDDYLAACVTRLLDLARHGTALEHS